MKIFFYALREFDELQYCEKFRDELGVDFGYSPEYPSLSNLDLARGCDTISTTPCDMSADIIEGFHERGVKYIACRSIGFDHVNREKAKELGMKVSNVFYPPNGVANYAILLMMNALRKLPQILKRGEIQDYSLKGKIGRDISNCTVGVIGTGKIGETVIRNLSGFGCRIYAYDLYEKESVKQYATYVSLEELYQKADVITLHAAATEENYHLICKRAIDQMKAGVIIVNTSRGKLIDTEDLIAGLESGKIGGAALDVLENENGLYYYKRIGDVIENREMAILRSFPNVILSPHTAFYTEENIGYMVRGCFESCVAFNKGEETIHDVSL
ncbi:MAG: D-isomer specific 2-hydroxyacid dehydrogenase family protein [Lachnospiraceae bacterium]|nr:D-isomer specific 2-hydroxyacid dehydrogenase family protein [Lachnospiraceae bacterium]